MASLAGNSITGNGLGMMRLTWHVGPTPDEIAFAVLKEALANGVNVWNGADFYGTPSYNSLHLMNRYFTAYPEDASKVVLSIKSGIVNMKTFEMDCSPKAMSDFVDSANKILDGKKKIDVFGPARVDPKVDIEITVKALAELVKEGRIGGIQLSEVSADTIKRASKVTKIDMVEEEMSLWATDVWSNGVVEACAEEGIVLIAHTPLGAGMLTGQIKSVDDFEAGDHHRFFPRFQGENFKKNLQLVDEVKQLAEKKGCTAAQLALNWLKRDNGKEGKPWIVPVAGARSVERLRENSKDVRLSERDLESVNKILESFPVVGTRYPAAAMTLVEF